MNKLGIIFLHHKTDDVTINNLQSFKKWNPDAVFVTMSPDEALPGGYSIQNMPDWLEKWKVQTSKPDMLAKSTDLLIYAWYANRKENCEKWLIVEWDTFCNCSVEDYFGQLIEQDLVGAYIQVLGKDNWYWFPQLNSFPEILHKNAAGIVPMSLVLVSDTALNSIYKSLDVFNNNFGAGNGELRFATLAKFAGHEAIHNSIGAGINEPIKLPENLYIKHGMFHPIKHVVKEKDLTPRVDNIIPFVCVELKILKRKISYILKRL